MLKREHAEIRTTPRELRDGTTAHGYVVAVLEAIDQATAALDIKVGLLLSIDRSLNHAEEVVNLAISFVGWSKVVGIDVGGNPHKGDLITDVLPALRKARMALIPITIHCGEIHNDAEVDAVISFMPERIGHGLILSPAHITRLSQLSSRIPIEICPTSNVKTLQLARLEDHPTARLLLERKYPLCINTDDSGVFATDSSSEYRLFATAMNLEKSELARITADSASFSFLSGDQKRAALDLIQRANKRLLWLDYLTFGLF